MTFTVLFICCLLELCCAAIYTHEWAVQIEGGEEAAKQLADEHDFTYLGKVSLKKIFLCVFTLTHVCLYFLLQALLFL